MNRAGYAGDRATQWLVLCGTRLPKYKGATARQTNFGGQWRRLGRKCLGRDGLFQSLISRRLAQGPERIRHQSQDRCSGCPDVGAHGCGVRP